MEETERNERKHSDAPKQKREKQQGAGLGIGRALGRSAARVRPGESEQRRLQREDYTKPGHPALNAWLGLGGVVGTARAPGTSGVQAIRTDTWGLTHRNGALWRVLGSPCPATTAVPGVAENARERYIIR